MATTHVPEASKVIAELVPNPRSRFRCPCGSGRPTLWLIVRDAKRSEHCSICVKPAWNETIV
jgi:hypothetical protein